MSDSRLRELERAWKESGAEADRRLWLRERVRVGELESTGWVYRKGSQLRVIEPEREPYGIDLWKCVDENLPRQPLRFDMACTNKELYIFIAWPTFWRLHRINEEGHMQDLRDECTSLQGSAPAVNLVSMSELDRIGVQFRQMRRSVNPRRALSLVQQGEPLLYTDSYGLYSLSGMLYRRGENPALAQLPEGWMVQEDAGRQYGFVREGQKNAPIRFGDQLFIEDAREQVRHRSAETRWHGRGFVESCQPAGETYADVPVRTRCSEQVPLAETNYHLDMQFSGGCHPLTKHMIEVRKPVLRGLERLAQRIAEVAT